MTAAYESKQQGLNKGLDTGKKDDAKVPAGQGKTGGLDLSQGQIASAFAKGESERTNKKGQKNDPYGTFNYYIGNKLYSSFYGKVNGKSIKEYSFKQLKDLSEPSNFTIQYTDGDPDKKVNGGRLFALGRYQIIPGTRAGLLAKLSENDSSITEDAIFSEKMQDLCYTQLIKDCSAVSKYLEDKNANDQMLDAAALRLAKVWASIGIKPGTKSKYGKTGAKDGLTSYYEGDKLNKGHISYDTIIEALKADRQAVQSGKMPVQTTNSGLAAKGATKTPAADASKETKASDESTKAGDAGKAAEQNIKFPSINIKSAINYNNKRNAGMIDYLQTYLNIEKTGVFDANTVKHIALWQQKAKTLTVDGKFGDKSFDYAMTHGLEKIMPKMLDEVVITGTKKDKPTANNNNDAGGAAGGDAGGAAGGDAGGSEQEVAASGDWKADLIAAGLNASEIYDKSELHTYGCEKKGKVSTKKTVTTGGNVDSIKTLQALLNRALAPLNLSPAKADNADKIPSKLNVTGKWDTATAAHLMYYIATSGRDIKSSGLVQKFKVSCDASLWKDLRDNKSLNANAIKTPVTCSLTGIPDTVHKITPGGETDFVNMRNAIKKDKGLPLSISSSYRTLSTHGMAAAGMDKLTGQLELFALRVGGIKSSDCAIPTDQIADLKASHMSGRALDLNDCKDVKDNNGKLVNSETFKWLSKNAKTYGFENYKPERWHWNYKPEIKPN